VVEVGVDELLQLSSQPEGGLDRLVRWEWENSSSKAAYLGRVDKLVR
jgi:hypothetical protein